MKDELLKLQKNSYSPYSHFPVSAIVVMNDGRKFYGVNVENASYGATICAERSAITSAITNGYTKGDFKELHVMTSSKDIGYPCSICRQLLLEFFPSNSLVYAYSKGGRVSTHTISELCPYPFGEDDLK